MYTINMKKNYFYVIFTNTGQIFGMPENHQTRCPEMQITGKNVFSVPNGKVYLDLFKFLGT